jgi:hypothetical protein
MVINKNNVNQRRRRRRRRRRTTTTTTTTSIEKGRKIRFCLKLLAVTITIT